MRIFTILSIILIFFLIASVSATDVNTNDTKKISTNNDKIVSVGNDLNAPNTDTNTYLKSSAKISSEKNTNKQMSIENDLDTSNNDKNTHSDNTKKASTKNNKQIVNAKNDLNVLTEVDGTYSDLRKEIKGHSGNITLTKQNYRYTDGDGSTIDIISNTTINGNGAIIDMVGSNIRAFYVSGSNVTIKNLTIKNAHNSNNGGAIYFKESGTLENCNFTNNNGDYGGAVCFNKDGNVTNCNFIGNPASRAGAIYFYSTTHTATITNCNFINNKATSARGGAIVFNTDNKFTLINCNFTNNTAEYGGAIRFDGKGNGDLTNCNFINNTANHGGALYFDKYTSTGTLENCNFTNNTANNDGGAIKFIGNGNVINCNFINNNASKNGGAVYFDTTSYTVTKSIFINNTAYTGYAIYKKNGNMIVNHTIFLNNGLNSVIYGDGSNNLDYNWFGNTAKNYTNMPSVEVTLNNWLFLNATLNDMSTINPVDVFSTNNITFKLFLYNSTKQEDNVSEYDNNLLYPANLMIQSEKGSVNIDSAKLGEKIVCVPNSVGSDSVSASIEGVSYTIPLTVAKTNPKLSVNSSTVTYLDPITLTLQYHDKATGKVNITLNSVNNKYSYSLLNQDLNTEISLASLDIKPEEYTVTVNYSGDDNFLNTTASSTLTVNKKEYTTNIQNLTVTPLYLDKPALIEGYLYANNNGLMKQNITLNISTSNGYQIYNLTTDNKGKFQITIKPDAIGIITIKVTYPGNTTPEYIYNTTSANITSNTEKVYYNITFDPLQTSYDYNATITITGTVTSNYQPLDVDNVNVTLNNDAQESIKLNNGKFTYTIKGTTIGLNNITITCKDATNTTQTFIKYPTTFTITVTNSTTNKPITITVKEANNFTGTINVKIDNKDYKVQLTNGKGSKNIKINTPGTYIANIKFPGNNKYTNATTNSNKFTIKYPTKFTIQKIPDTTTDKTITITVTESNGFTGTINVKIDNKDYKVQLTNGKGSKNIKINTPGTYIANIKFPGNNKYTNATTNSNKFTIKYPTHFTIQEISNTTTNKAVIIIIKESNRFTGTVNVKIGKKDYKVQLQNGEGKQNIKINTPGTYIATLKFPGNKEYTKTSTTSNKFTVKYPTQFTIQRIPNITEGSPIKLTVTEKNKYTGPVIIIIGSEKYTIKLNNGLGKKTITPKLAPGKYIAKIRFDGNEKYTPNQAVSNKFQINKKAVVVKLDTVIVAFKKTFYLEDTNKNYNISLKDVNGRFIKNALVTLKINRKTYKTKTDKKGLATFDLNNLNQKGKYTTLIKYNGDKKYKASNKKVKITVKILFPTVSKGSKDKKTVKKIQKALKNNGYYLHAGKYYLKIDGIYYTWTEKEVKRYQKNNKLPVTGKVDYNTAIKLGII